MESIYLLQSVASPALDAVAMAVTNFGHEFSYIGLLVVAYLAFDPSRSRRLGIYFLAALYLNQLLKGLFDTPRPFELDLTVLRGDAAEATAGGAAMPSGHAQSAGTFWGIAALYIGRRWFTVVALLLIVLVSLSRVYLGVHLPVDVLAGLGLAAVTVALVPLLDRVRFPGGTAWQFITALLLPLGMHLLAPTDNSALILGGLAGFLTAPMLYRFQPPASLTGRAAAALLGLVLVFATLFGSSSLLPEEFKRHLGGGFVRYLGLSYVGLVAAPALFDALTRWLPRRSNRKPDSSPRQRKA